MPGVTLVNLILRAKHPFISLLSTIFDIPPPPDILLLAASRGYSEKANMMIRFLIDKGADRSVVTGGGDTPLSGPVP